MRQHRKWPRLFTLLRGLQQHLWDIEGTTDSVVETGVDNITSWYYLCAKKAI